MAPPFFYYQRLFVSIRACLKQIKRLFMPVSAKDAQAVLARAECLIDNKTVQQALDKMALEIIEAMQDDNPLVLCVMTGGIIATSEIVKRLPFSLELDYLHATRYGDNIVGDKLDWIARPRKSLKGRTVLIIDDILDVGKTLSEIVEYCKAEGASKTYTAVLVNKEHERKEGMSVADFTGVSVPDRYVFGYGMDYKHYLRNVKGIFAAHKNDE